MATLLKLLGSPTRAGPIPAGRKHRYLTSEKRVRRNGVAKNIPVLKWSGAGFGRSPAEDRIAASFERPFLPI